MVVEDDSSLREWVEFELSMEGYDVSQAADGLMALTNLHAMQQLPDVLLLDVQLPGMDGFTLCKTLQQAPATASIPIIFLTARTTTDDKLTGFASGGVDYLTKPFKMVELKARLEQLARLDDDGGQYAETVYRLSIVNARACGNRRLARTVTALSLQTLRYSKLGLAARSRRQASLKMWKAGLAALRRGDAPTFAALARQRVEASGAEAARALEPTPPTRSPR